MASSRPWPFDDDENRPSGSVRPLSCGSAWQPAGPPVGAVPRRAGGLSDWLGTVVPAQPGRHRLATRGGGGAAHRPASRPAGAARLGGPARPGRPAEPGQHRPLGGRPRWSVRDRLQALSGRLQLDGSGRMWHGRYPLAPTLRTVDYEADQAAQVLVDPDVVVVPIVAVHGAQVPWGKVVTQGVPVVAAKRLPSMLRQLPAVLGPERVAWLADQARIRFHAAA
jgi:hypothetical protein